MSIIRKVMGLRRTAAIVVVLSLVGLTAACSSSPIVVDLDNKFTELQCSHQSQSGLFQRQLHGNVTAEGSDECGDGPGRRDPAGRDVVHALCGL
jgi:hypothetical protein